MASPALPCVQRVRGAPGGPGRRPRPLALHQLRPRLDLAARCPGAALAAGRPRARPAGRAPGPAPLVAVRLALVPAALATAGLLLWRAGRPRLARALRHPLCPLDDGWAAAAAPWQYGRGPDGRWWTSP